MKLISLMRSLILGSSLCSRLLTILRAIQVTNLKLIRRWLIFLRYCQAHWRLNLPRTCIVMLFWSMENSCRAEMKASIQSTLKSSKLRRYRKTLSSPKLVNLQNLYTSSWTVLLWTKKHRDTLSQDRWSIMIPFSSDRAVNTIWLLIQMLQFSNTRKRRSSKYVNNFLASVKTLRVTLPRRKNMWSMMNTSAKT